MTIDSDGCCIFSTESPLDKLIVEKNGNGFILVGCSKCDLFIYIVNGLDCHKETWSNAKLIYNNKLDNFIVDLVSCDEKVYIVLSSGAIFSLESGEPKHEYEDDIFSLDDSSETSGSWRVVELCHLPGVTRVVSAVSSKLGLCILAEVRDSLQIFIFKTTIISCCTVSERESSCGCLYVVGISSLSFDFMNLWLPHAERSEEFLFVGLENGCLLCCPLTPALKLYKVYRSIHSIIAISWFQDRNSDRFDSLIIVLDSGAVVRLTPIGQEVSFPFLPFLTTAIISKNSIISLGEFETRLLKFSDSSNQSLSFPISEVTGVCSINNTSALLVSDIRSNLFLIDLENINKLNETLNTNKKFCDPLPFSSDLKRLIASSIHLSQVNKTLITLDEYLRAKSLVSRCDILKEHFVLSSKVVQVLGNLYTMRMKISFTLPGIVFSKEFWKLNLNVVSMEDCGTYTWDLSTSISYEKSLIQLVTVKLPFDLMYDFDCKLVSHVQSKHSELQIPLSKVEMNASYFLFPPSLKELCKGECAKEDSLWIDENFQFCLTVSLIEEPSDVEEFLTEMLSESKALWRHTEWHKTIKSHKIHCILFGRDINFKITEKDIVIESSDLKACQALRLAFLIKLNKNKLSNYKQGLAQSLMGWHQAKNIIKLSQDPRSHLMDLYSILKNTSSLR